MNDQTLDRTEIHDDHKKNEMDSMILDHKKMFDAHNIPLSESQFGMARKSSDDYETNALTFQSQINKPTVTFETSLSVNMRLIKDIFNRVCKKRGFSIIDDEREQITAMRKQYINLKDLCINCFTGKFKNLTSITTLRLTSKTNKITCRRKIVLKGLIGEIKLIKAVFFDFSNELEVHEPRPSPHKITGSSLFGDQLLIHSRYVPITEENNSDGEELAMSPQNLESYSFYEFRKILSSDQYAIGKKVAEFFKDFFESYGDSKASASLLPQPMAKVFYKINQVTETFFADFNYGKSETRKIMPFCKTSVEKFLFEKVYSNLFGMYQIKFDKQSTMFREQTHEILKEKNHLKHLKFLEIPLKFWLINPDKLTEAEELKEPLQEHEIPYINAINEFSKISKVRSPKEKLAVLLMVNSLMKSSVVEYHQGKQEITSMDEQLPILIYVVLHCQVENIAAELNFIHDFVNLDPTLESEEMLMANFKMSVEYISEKWKNE